MKDFFQITIDGRLHLINVNNVALIKQINGNITEINLFTKDKNNEQIKFRVAHNYMFFVKALDSEDEFFINGILNEFKD